MLKLEINDVWQKVLNRLEKETPAPVFKAFIKPLIPLAADDGLFTLASPYAFIKDQVESNYGEKLTAALCAVCGENVAVRIENIEGDENNRPEDFSADSAVMEAKKEGFPPEEEFAKTLNGKYNFDTFVVGNSNRFAHAAALAVSETPAKVYNPLFIYGGVGLGKTHLMHAIGQKIKENIAGSRVIYTSSEKFTNEFINSISNKTSAEGFRKKYRNIDCLLIDDIQFLAKKEQTKEEFFHTFNTLFDSNKQIVIASDRPPKEIMTLEARLVSRFESGLIADIHPPDQETRIAILRKKAQSADLVIDNEVLAFIASKIKNNIRELEGAFLKVIAFSSINNTPITLESTVSALKNIIGEKISRPVNADLILDKISVHYKIKKEDILAQRRSRNTVFPRHVAMYLLRDLTDYSFSKIGEIFSGRNYSTVIHAVQKITNDMEKDKKFEQEIKEIAQKILNSN
ncbi:MAG: chromosomal replication initiator protein DnaA [Acidaminococcales bacterium]|jgi:chromosomal replication initiator protein|nr:chromosomal replication initiator protein DnaA [Acidaminococcales bacterium]